MKILTGSERIFRIIVKASITTAKRLMIDVRAVREEYQLGEISEVGWIRSAHNLADGLTKYEKSKILVDFLERGRLTTSVEQWVIRKVIGRQTGDSEDAGGPENELS